MVPDMIQRITARALCVLAFCVVVAGPAGCSDPASQRRIQIRQQHLADQAAGAARQEQHAEERLREVGPTVQHWWRDDVELFNQRMATIGDYVW